MLVTTDWLIDRLIDWLTNSLIDWSIDRLIDWLIDWLIRWLIYCLTDWECIPSYIPAWKSSDREWTHACRQSYEVLPQTPDIYTSSDRYHTFCKRYWHLWTQKNILQKWKEKEHQVHKILEVVSGTIFQEDWRPRSWSKLGVHNTRTFVTCVNFCNPYDDSSWGNFVGAT